MTLIPPWLSLSAMLTVFIIVLNLVWRLFTKKAPDMGSMPTVNFGIFSFFRVLFQFLYKNKTVSVTTYVLQGICAICTLFEKEKIGYISMLFRPYVMLFKVETVEAVLNSHTVIDKAKDYNFLHEWLGTGLLTSTGEKWRMRRKLLTPSFHFRILEEFVSVFNEQSEILVNKLKDVSQKKCVDIVPFVTMCTLDVICESTMGVRINAQTNPESEYVKSYHDIAALLWYRIARPWLWNDKIFFLTSVGRKLRSQIGLVHEFTRKVIKKKKDILLRNKHSSKNESRQGDIETKKRKKAFLELLLELHIEDASLSEEDIREEVDTFMFEGHDTTAMAICWTLYSVGLHPEIQDKVMKEIETIFGDDKERHINNDDIKAMKYLDCVIKESLRLYPSVPVFAREVKEDITILGYTIKPHSVVAIVPYILHRDPSVYPNPEVFDPDRFLPENSIGRHPYAYLPFSAGPRNCIGQKFAMLEEKVILASIFRNFEVKSLDPRDRVFIMTDVILRSDGPLRLTFTPK